MKSYHVFLVLIFVVFANGCQTASGAANGLAQDIHNTANPNYNGWTALQKMDNWVNENLW